MVLHHLDLLLQVGAGGNGGDMLMTDDPGMYGVTNSGGGGGGSWKYALDRDNGGSFLAGSGIVVVRYPVS